MQTDLQTVLHITHIKYKLSNSIGPIICLIQFGNSFSRQQRVTIVSYEY